MNIAKAIEIQEMDIADPGSVAIEDVNEAEKLGIEALKRIDECRLADHMIAEDYLPGETVD